MFKFNALIPKHCYKDVVHWHGFNGEGTHVFGTQYYNNHEVKVYRAGILGNIHEIAHIHFAGYAAKPLFYSKTHELVLLLEVVSVYMLEMYRDLPAIGAGIGSEDWCIGMYSLVIFNVNTGQLKRYYAKISEAVLQVDHSVYVPRLITAEDDALVLQLATRMFNSNIITAQLFTIFLNQADETFSPQLLAALAIPVLIHQLDFVYTRGRLIAKQEIYFDHLFSYDFGTQQWSTEHVEFDGQMPAQFDREMLSFDGHNLIYVDVSTDIGIFQLNVEEHRWKKLKVFNGYPAPDEKFNSCLSTLVSPNLQTLRTFVQKSITITDNVDVLITVYHDEGYMPCLTDLCIRVLLSYFAKFGHEMSDHDVCKLLALEMIGHIYFGRLFL